ncbi:MAG TPA: hypothetical protein VG186_05295 [Solirubrobacteraceae bacterium]|jgi:hypothetical protein|nr:hypothetical protein [Solirubrobacteraceae bacterium]
MSGEETIERSTERSASVPVRLRRAWKALPADRRLAAGAALGLFLTLFLPWYQETGLASGGRGVQTATVSLTGWAAFSWVEAAVLLVAVGVLALIFLRSEGRAFHLPGGDGIIVTVAGGWTCLLVIWRIFDKQGVSSRGQFATTSGIEWGIFITLGVAGVLAYAGSRIRAAHTPEPPLPGEDAEPWPETPQRPDTPRRSETPSAPAPAAALARRSRRAAWAEPVTWDEPTGLTEPRAKSAKPAPTAPMRLVEPADGPHQLSIPLDGDPPAWT